MLCSHVLLWQKVISNIEYLILPPFPLVTSFINLGIDLMIVLTGNVKRMHLALFENCSKFTLVTFWLTVFYLRFFFNQMKLVHYGVNIRASCRNFQLSSLYFYYLGNCRSHSLGKFLTLTLKISNPFNTLLKPFRRACRYG